MDPHNHRKFFGVVGKYSWSKDTRSGSSKRDKQAVEDRENYFKNRQSSDATAAARFTDPWGNGVVGAVAEPAWKQVFG